MQARNSTKAGTEKRKIKVGKERLPRKGTKAGTKSHKCRHGKPQRQARNGTNASDERH